jgi:hypothetical protein
MAARAVCRWLWVRVAAQEAASEEPCNLTTVRLQLLEEFASVLVQNPQPDRALRPGRTGCSPRGGFKIGRIERNFPHNRRSEFTGDSEKLQAKSLRPRVEDSHQFFHLSALAACLRNCNHRGNRGVTEPPTGRSNPISFQPHERFSVVQRCYNQN